MIVRLNPDGSQHWSSAGNGSFCDYVCGVAVGDDEVFVCDCSNDRLQVLSVSDGLFIRTIGDGKTMKPQRVAFDPIARVLLVGENGKILVWSLDGTSVHSWGSEGRRYGHFNKVWNLVISPVDDSVWVADCLNCRIQVF